MQEDSDQLLSQRNEPLKFHTSECSHLQTEGLFNLPGSHSLTYKQRLPPPAPHSTLGMLLFFVILAYNTSCIGIYIKHAIAADYFSSSASSS